MRNHISSQTTQPPELNFLWIFFIVYTNKITDESHDWWCHWSCDSSLLSCWCKIKPKKFNIKSSWGYQISKNLYIDQISGILTLAHLSLDTAAINMAMSISRLQWCGRSYTWVCVPKCPHRHIGIMHPLSVVDLPHSFEL